MCGAPMPDVIKQDTAKRDSISRRSVSGTFFDGGVRGKCWAAALTFAVLLWMLTLSKLTVPPEIATPPPCQIKKFS